MNAEFSDIQWNYYNSTDMLLFTTQDAADGVLNNAIVITGQFSSADNIEWLADMHGNAINISAIG
ncbi:hypothetical protein [Marinobacterium arenosum]|uniref:hypothetical protein n=1 Tax=Marinobacterium arenosum TaxID=2862496 RepID=UPI001C947FA9|nr:hypothetical protein [Marinobacterium arenosum]MBY4676223.1 hypothetical protein [Marinobacterium arenosum]